MNDAEYGENGKLITKRTSKQNRFYRAFVNDCVLWHEKKKHIPKYGSMMSSKQKKYLHEYFHLMFKIDVLMYEMGLSSTTNLNTQQVEELIAYCHVYLAEKKIDIYEFKV